MLQNLADCMLLGPLLGELVQVFGHYDLVAHWQQGEFHHDSVIKLRDPKWLPGDVLVVSTNCNGGVKEVLCLDEVPGRWALWHHRCPDNDEFEGELPPVLGRARTSHWFEPCELLRDDARSELRAEHRRRQRGGGWMPLWKPDD